MNQIYETLYELAEFNRYGLWLNELYEYRNWEGA